MSNKNKPVETTSITPSRITAHISGDPFRDPTKSESDPQWEGFKDTLKKLARVPKEEVDAMRAEHEREKK